MAEDPRKPDQVDEEKVAKKKDDKVGLLALGALVLFLGGVVYWAIPKDDAKPPATSADAGAGPATSSGARTTPTDDAIAPRTKNALERLGEATCELFILTDKPEAKVQEVANVDGIVKLLDVRYCGAACDAVKKNMADKDRFEVEVSKTDDYILPPKTSFDTVAPTLTPAERATIDKKPVGVVIRARGPSTIDQLPARTCFAATAALAETLGGFVYDETLRRIETAPQLTAHAITAPLGQSVFTPKHIVVQLYKQEDGTARVLTLGMVRFGSPDFTLHGSAMELGSSLASIANTVAAYAAAARTESPVVVTIADVARASGKKPEELAKSPADRTPLKLVSFDHERVEGDPENDMIELLPLGAAQEDDARREAWLAAVQGLFGDWRVRLPDAGAR